MRFINISFIRQSFPSASTTGTPKFYAQFDDDTFIIAPTPDSNYTVELHYFYIPTSITASADGESQITAELDWYRTYVKGGAMKKATVRGVKVGIKAR